MQHEQDWQAFFEGSPGVWGRMGSRQAQRRIGVAYFRCMEVKGIFEELDGWLRRKLRRILWKQWKRPYTRAKNLRRRGLSEATAWRSATNGRGPWWNAGAAHMHNAVPKSCFDKLGLVSLIDQLHRLQHTS